MNRPSPSGEAATLSRELGDFLIELSIGLHKNAIYPPGHPLLTTATAGIMRRLEALLRERQTLSLGVARKQLIIEGVATDDNNPVLRDLAARLHRHHLGAVKISQGADAREIASVLAALAIDVGRRERPMGMEPSEYLNQWPHVRLLPMTFDQLQLLDDEPGEGDGEGGEGAKSTARGRAAQLWVGLAQAALASDSTALPSGMMVDDQVGADPMVVAKAINESSRDVAYDQVVVGYLLQIADELKSKGGQESAALQLRLSRLMAGLDDASRKRLLEMGGDSLQRRKFMLDSTQLVAVDAVLELVASAADSAGQNISHSMMRMLSKLAMHAETRNSPVKSAADGELRDQVSKLIKDWELDDPNPDAYRMALERMATEAPVFQGVDQYPTEPERLVAMGFEIEVLGEPVWRSVDQMLERDDFTPLLDLLDAAPPGWMREAVWHYVASPARLHAVLQRQPVNIALVHRLVAQMKIASVEPLLDAIEASEDRTATALMDILAGMGTEIGGFIVPRLASARWPLLRTFLAVLGRLPEWPAGSSPRDYVSHPDSAVRREALRIMMRTTTNRDDAVTQALADGDERVVRLAMGAAMTNCPPAAAAVLRERTNDPSLSPDLRALGVRVLAAVKSPDTVTWLVARTLGKKRFFFFLKRPLAAKTPEMLAALSGLAAHWANDPQAQIVLTLARKSSDPEIVDAVSIRGGSGDE